MVSHCWVNLITATLELIKNVLLICDIEKKQDRSNQFLGAGEKKLYNLFY